MVCGLLDAFLWMSVGQFWWFLTFVTDCLKKGVNSGDSGCGLEFFDAEIVLSRGGHEGLVLNSASLSDLEWTLIDSIKKIIHYTKARQISSIPLTDHPLTPHQITQTSTHTKQPQHPSKKSN